MAADNLAPIRRLTCACCGAATFGRQWHNQDTGYGVCVPCVEEFISKRETPEEIERLYGARGVHWGLFEGNACLCGAPIEVGRETCGECIASREGRGHVRR